MARGTIQDPVRGEVVVETGSGAVDTINRKTPDARNAQVAIKNPDLRIPITGWVDTLQNGAAYDVALQAQREGRLVTYRVEVHRKDGVDVSRPIADLAPQDKVRDLVSVTFAGGPPAAANGNTPPPQQQTLDQGQQVANTPAADGWPAEAHQAQAARDRDEQHAPRPGVKMQEGRPYDETNSDGSPNPGSYSAQACISMAEWAWELLCAAHVAAHGDRPDPDPDRVLKLATSLLTMCDRVQKAIRRDARVDRMDGSHPRARGAVRLVVQWWPPPLDADLDDRRQWVEAVVERATSLLRIGLVLDSEGPKA